jgi:hypothetical protein
MLGEQKKMAKYKKNNKILVEKNKQLILELESIKPFVAQHTLVDNTIELKGELDNSKEKESELETRVKLLEVEVQKERKISA